MDIDKHKKLSNLQTFIVRYVIMSMATLSKLTYPQTMSKLCDKPELLRPTCYVIVYSTSTFPSPSPPPPKLKVAITHWKMNNCLPLRLQNRYPIKKNDPIKPTLETLYSYWERFYYHPIYVI